MYNKCYPCAMPLSISRDVVSQEDLHSLLRKVPVWLIFVRLVLLEQAPRTQDSQNDSRP